MKKYLCSFGLIVFGLANISLVYGETGSNAISEKQNSQALKWTFDGTRDKLLEEVNVFFADARGSYINSGSWQKKPTATDAILVRTQFQHVFGGIPYKQEVLSSGDELLAASDPEDTNSKAILVTSPNDHQILAAALIHRNCGRNNNRTVKVKAYDMEPGCDKRPTVTVFYANQNSSNENIKDSIAKWAKSNAISHNQATKGNPRERIKTMNLQTVILTH